MAGSSLYILVSHAGKGLEVKSLICGAHFGLFYSLFNYLTAWGVEKGKAVIHYGSIVTV